ncbi:MAG: UDP-N-acetylglucosamine 2-epimerase (non-hydrolyzing) [Oscillospiraceae bacterium]|nr:UDP-N-acetylglucosamine 2-epimerase (non-hydrolyzing) [Oscillospiraceae bacterium]
MIKIMTIFGTRPEAVKMAPLIRVLRACGDVEALCCVTGQHRHMLDVPLRQFGITPDRDLDIMAENQTLPHITSRALCGLDGVLASERPDMALVHGDTSTTFAAALAAFYNKIPVGHVEAGLRTGDRYSPFPEEMNRSMTARLAALHFCPTASNRGNLLSEGISEGIFVTGNTVIDALGLTVVRDYEFETRGLAPLPERFILATLHRRENYGQAMDDILHAFADILDACPDVSLILPVHLSPVVRAAVYGVLGGHPRARLVEPLPVTDMHNLMARCELVMTDSGGLQEEAPALGKPVLVLRRETERPEAVAAGTVKLSGVSRERVRGDALALLTDRAEYERMARAANPYGDGRASERIRDAILWHFGLRGQKPDDFISG